MERRSTCSADPTRPAILSVGLDEARRSSSTTRYALKIACPKRTPKNEKRATDRTLGDPLEPVNAEGPFFLCDEELIHCYEIQAIMMYVVKENRNVSSTN
jgi:hypothetical protein